MLDYKITISVGAIILLIILLIVMILCSEGYINTQERNKSDEIREDFPQTSPMNVLYSDANGNLSSTSDLGVNYLSVNNNISANGRIYFRNKGHSDDSDVYFLEKKNESPNNNSLRLYINDDADESFQIWGNSCADGCSDDGGRMKHKFVANGNAEHTGALSAGSISTSGALSAGSISSGDITTTGSLTAKGDIYFTGGNNWTIHTPDNDRNNRSLYFGPSTEFGNTTPNWSKAVRFYEDGSIQTPGTLSIPSYTNVKNTLDDIYAKISALDTKVNTLDGNVVKKDVPIKFKMNNPVHKPEDQFFSIAYCNECSGGNQHNYSINMSNMAGVGEMPTSKLKFFD